MAKSSAYEGSVCYQDGWHYTVVADADGNETPDARLFLDDDGSYRLATDADQSWHERKHGQFVTVQMEDGSAAVTVTADEMAAIQELLAEKRGQA